MKLLWALTFLLARVGAEQTIEEMTADAGVNLTAADLETISQLEADTGNLTDAGNLTDTETTGNLTVTDANFEAFKIAAFANAAALDDVYNMTIGTSLVTNFDGLFQDQDLGNVSFAQWDTSSVTSMDRAFQRSTGRIPVTDWDTSSVTSMDSIFEGSEGIDFNSWNTASVTSMARAFADFRGQANEDAANEPYAVVSSGSCASHGFEPITTLAECNAASVALKATGDVAPDLSTAQERSESSYVPGCAFDDLNWLGFNPQSDATAACGSDGGYPGRTHNCLCQYHAFFPLTEISWDTSSVRDMTGMFHGAPLSIFLELDTSSVTSMRDMFEGSAGSIDGLGAWNVAAVRDFKRMFYNSSFGTAAVGAWDIAAVPTGAMAGMFGRTAEFGCSDVEAVLAAWEPQRRQPCSSLGYAVVSSGSCASNGFEPITTVEECNAARISLAISNTAGTFNAAITGSAGSIPGCQFGNNWLGFNTNSEAAGECG